MADNRAHGALCFGTHSIIVTVLSPSALRREPVRSYPLVFTQNAETIGYWTHYLWQLAEPAFNC